VTLNATQTIGCPLTAALDQWVTEVVQPVANARFGEPVVTIDTLGAYSCRPIDNIHGAHLSEHSFGNAIDIGGFRLASGHRIEVVRAWARGDPGARLRQVSLQPHPPRSRHAWRDIDRSPPHLPSIAETAAHAGSAASRRTAGRAGHR
jgi:hypothetical protein